MGLEDREWYREEMRRRQQASVKQGQPSAFSSGLPKPRAPYRSSKLWFPVVILLFAAIVGIARDMKDRGVPVSWHGFKWWLSLWFGV